MDPTTEEGVDFVLLTTEATAPPPPGFGDGGGSDDAEDEVSQAAGIHVDSQYVPYEIWLYHAFPSLVPPPLPPLPSSCRRPS